MMRTDALPVTTRRGEDLRYVTEHFRDLQGLYLAWLWAELLGLSLVSTSTQISRGHLLIAAVIMIAVFFAVGIPCTHAWYKRYGVVEGRDPKAAQAKPLSILEPHFSRPRASLGLFWVWLVVIGLVIGTGLFRKWDPYRGTLNVWLVLWLTLPKCFYPTPDNGFIRLRRAFYIAGSGIIFLAVASAVFRGPMHVSRWLLPEIVCGTLLLLSVYDHWLLGYWLGGSRKETLND